LFSWIWTGIVSSLLLKVLFFVFNCILLLLNISDSLFRDVVSLSCNNPQKPSLIQAKIPIDLVNMLKKRLHSLIDAKGNDRGQVGRNEAIGMRQRHGYLAQPSQF
jgi:hypothetical protein